MRARLLAALAVLAAVAAVRAGGAQCFCEIKGAIDGCSCSAETLESINKKLFPTLIALVKTDFFKFYKVNLHRGCRFWQSNSICTSPKCEVQACRKVRPVVCRPARCNAHAGGAAHRHHLRPRLAGRSAGPSHSTRSWAAC